MNGYSMAAKRRPIATSERTMAVGYSVLQRRCTCGGLIGPKGECDKCRRKQLDLQNQAVNQHAPFTMPPEVYEVLRSPGQPLDPATRAFMQQRLEHDFSQVRVHTSSRAAESARAMDALAYTAGQDIVFGAEQYQPATQEGRRLLAHELAHTVQQTMGTPAPGINPSGDSHETEANRAAAAVLAGKRVFLASAGAPPTVQRQDLRLTPPSLLEPRTRHISLFPPGREPYLQLNLLDDLQSDLLVLRGIRDVRPRTFTLPAALRVPPMLPPPTTPDLPPLQFPARPRSGTQSLDEPDKIWDVDFNLDVEPLSQMGQFLTRWSLPLQTPAVESMQRTSQILAVLTGHAVEDTPLGLRLLNAGVNILTTRGPASTFLQRMHLRDVTLVVNPSSGTYGLSVQFKLP